MKLRGLVSNSYIHVSVNNIYIPGIGYRDMNVEIKRQNIFNSVLEITRPCSFISGNTSIETRHLYWILTSPSFVVRETLIILATTTVCLKYGACVIHAYVAFIYFTSLHSCICTHCTFCSVTLVINPTEWRKFWIIVPN